MSNPFDELGLKKELVEYLSRSGRLDVFLKTYVRSVQLQVHPDKGGNADLSAAVNSAYAEINQNPGRVTGWIATMKNGTSPEYEVVLEGLVGEVERLRKVEKDHEELRRKHAEVLAGGSGVSTAPRTAPTAFARRRTPEPTEVPPRRAAPEARRPTPEPRPRAPPASAVYAGYVFMDKTPTYARGVKALKKACRTDPASAHPSIITDAVSVYRPLTFKENVEAMVKNYNTEHNPDGSARTMVKRLFLITKRWKDSCTGMAYKAKTTKFKVIPQCSDLMTIAPDFDGVYLPISYAGFDAPELNSGKRGMKYNELLTKAEIAEHEGWRTAVEGDVALLRGYRDIVFEAIRARDGRMPDKAMPFLVLQNTDFDELRALSVRDLEDDSEAYGDYYLDDYGSFLRVAHR
ncbi:hypothetical protein HYX14_03230 [Candidatus Woesearchaeota archaeon]|nr:hypothetical protein [Candidatus Woesearchaeota archaeon]